jgi:hypothetical protein
VNGIPPPVVTGERARRPSQPEEKAELKNGRASPLPRTLETKSLPKQPPPDQASRSGPQPTSAERRWIDPHSESGPRQETAQEPALQPRPAPSEPLPAPEPLSSPAPEPAQEQGPAPEPAQTAQVPEPVLEPAPQPSLEPASEPVAAPSLLGSLPATPDIFSPEPISERPTTLFLPDAQGTGWFDEAFEHGRPEEAKIPRLLREPSPPPLRSEEEP